MNKKVWCLTFIYISVLLIILAIDYCNILSFITLKLNYNYLSIIVGTITTIYLFWITYYLIDKRISDNEKEKKKNKKSALYIMLSETYKKCNEVFILFNDDTTLTKYIVPKVDFNKIIDPFIEQQKNNVFKYNSKILELVSDGIVDRETLEQYINIKETFSNYISLKVTLFDVNLPKYKGNVRVKSAKKELDLREKKLKKDLECAMIKISEKL